MDALPTEIHHSSSLCISRYIISEGEVDGGWLEGWEWDNFFRGISTPMDWLDKPLV